MNKLPSNKKILEKVLQRRKEFVNKTHFYNYPGKFFYLSASLYFTTEQPKELFGKTMPFLFGFVKDGAAFWEFPSTIGPARVFFNNLKSRKEEYLDDYKKQVASSFQKFSEWHANTVVEGGMTLKYYLNLLSKSNALFIETSKYSQICLFVDDLVKEEINKEFDNVCLSEDQLLLLSASAEPSDAKIHEDALASLASFCKKEKINLSKKSFEKLSSNTNFFGKLSACHSLGYFLHASYGGVTIWSLKDEFSELVKKSREKHSSQKRAGTLMLQLTKEQKFWIAVAKYLSFLRDRRKSMQQKVFYFHALVLEQISKITGFPRKDLENLSITQLSGEALSNKTLIKQLIEEQKKGLLIAWYPTSNWFFESGDSAKERYDKISQYFSSNNLIELRGVTACSGKVKGIVRVIFNTHEKYSFDEGDILVTGMTSPDFVPLMKKAGAIVTERGGLTCHAAIISRELAKPCIIGTKIATKLLTPGDFVEVNASKGFVKVLKKVGNQYE